MVEGKAPLRVLGETAYPLTAASARVRVANFAPFLGSEGVDLTFRPTLSDGDYGVLKSEAAAPRKAMVLAKSVTRAALPRDGYDLLLVHRLRLLNPFPGLDPPRGLDVYDLDDALFLGFPAEVNRRFQWTKQEARRSIQCMRRARLVLAGNSFLAAKASEYARRVEVVPSCVATDGQPLHEHGPADTVNVGWIGSHTSSANLEPLLEVFARLNESRLRARLVVVGGDTGVRAEWVVHRPWSLEREPDELAGFDIGIMPLPDTEWAKGKCGYKLLQYFAAGVPGIASPVGVAPELIGAERGLLAASPEEWYEALDRLIRDHDERRERGVAARDFVKRRYSYRHWAPELAGLLRSLAA